jgi:hypothetical protein
MNLFPTFLTLLALVATLVEASLVNSVDDTTVASVQIDRVMFNVTPNLTIPDRMFREKCSLRDLISSKENFHNSWKRRLSLVDENAFSGADDNTTPHYFMNLQWGQSVGHGFIQAAVTAFSEHYPFVMRPQHVWILILQAVAEHVNQHSAELKSKWIATPDDSKQSLMVEKKPTTMSEANSWANLIFTEDEVDDKSFLNQIRSHTVEGAFEDMMLPLSGTTAIEKVSMGITVMSALQAYFTYRTITSCGFPYIIMEGTLEDWQMIRKKAEELIQTRCLSSFAEKWLPALLSILDKFVSEYENAATVTADADENF